MLVNILIFVGLIIVWLVWTGYATNKEIRKGLESVRKDHQYSSWVSVKEYIRYAEKQGLEAKFYRVQDNGFIVYGDKVITLVTQKGNTILFINAE